jgi:hypothetical protein
MGSGDGGCVPGILVCRVPRALGVFAECVCGSAGASPSRGVCGVVAGAAERRVCGVVAWVAGGCRESPRGRVMVAGSKVVVEGRKQEPGLTACGWWCGGAPRFWRGGMGCWWMPGIAEGACDGGWLRGFGFVERPGTRCSGAPGCQKSCQNCEASVRVWRGRRVRGPLRRVPMGV